MLVLGCLLASQNTEQQYRSDQRKITAIEWSPRSNVCPQHRLPSKKDRGTRHTNFQLAHALSVVHSFSGWEVAVACSPSCSLLSTDGCFLSPDTLQRAMAPGGGGGGLCSTHADGILGFLEDVLDVLLRLQPIHLVCVALFSAPLHLLFLPIEHDVVGLPVSLPTPKTSREFDV